MSAGPAARPAAPHPAGLPARLASMAYEALLLVPILFIAGWLFLLLFDDATSTWTRPLFQLWLLLVLGLHFGYCWVKSGQTLAMKTWRVRVERADGTRLSPREAALRFVLACWGLALAGIGFLWALVDRDRQFLHDRLLGTRLVRLPRPAKGR